MPKYTVPTLAPASGRLWAMMFLLFCIFFAFYSVGSSAVNEMVRAVGLWYLDAIYAFGDLVLGPDELE